MTTPTNRTPDDWLEARLQAVFERDIARAGGQLANGEVVLERRPPSPLMRFATSPAAITAAAVVVLALIVGAVSWKAGPNPPAAGSGPANAPGSAIPSFGEPVWPVGEGALEQIQASRTDAPFLISGWLIGAAPNPQCQGAASPTVISAIDVCDGLTLHASPLGGTDVTVLAVHMPPLAPDQARQVVLRVHTHDASCGTDFACSADAVLSEVAWAGEVVQLPIAPPSDLAGNGTIDGPVYPVGNGAEERAQTVSSRSTYDKTPFLVSGWLIGTGMEPTCSPSPSTAAGSLDSCPEFSLYPAPGGGPAMIIARPYAVTLPSVDALMARRVVVRVAARDPDWTTICRTNGSCFGSVDLVSVVQTEDPVAVPTQASAPVANAISNQQAEDAAAMAAFGGAISPDLAVVSSSLGAAGTSSLLWPSVDASRLVWTVTLAHVGDGKTDEIVVVLDALTGQSLGSAWPGPQAAVMPAPGQTIPATINEVPVHTGDDARAVLAQSSGVPVLIGGWIQGLDHRVCDPEANMMRSGLWSPCAGFWLHDTANGGAPLVVLSGVAIWPTGPLPASSTPADGEAVPVVLRVANTHASFPGVADGTYPVADEVIWTGTPIKTLDIGTPPAGVSLAAAEKAGQSYVLDKQRTMLRVSARITLAAYTAITGASFSAPGVSPDSWVWLLLYTDSSDSPSSAQAVLVTLADGRPVGGTGTFP